MLKDLKQSLAETPKSEHAEILLHAAKMLDKELHSVLDDIGANPSYFDNCNFSAMELSLLGFDDSGPIPSVSDLMEDYGFEDFN